MRDGEGSSTVRKTALGEVQHWVRRGQERRAAATAAAEEKATKELTCHHLSGCFDRRLSTSMPKAGQVVVSRANARRAPEARHRWS